MSIAHLFSAAAALTIASAVVGCSDDSGTSSPPGPAATKLSVVPAIFVGENQPMAELADGGSLPLVVPPQGGHVLFVGASIKGARSSVVKLRSVLTAPDGTVVAADARTVALEVDPDDPTKQRTKVASYTQQSNLTLCPNYNARAVDGEEHELLIEVTELYVDGAQPASTTRKVTPGCATSGPDAQLCACECGASYVLGKCSAAP